MTALFKKLNYKAQPALYILDAPPSFAGETAAMSAIAAIHTSLTKAPSAPFVLAFATQQEQVDQFADQIASRSEGDAVIWIAYPKGTSKKYKCDFNRDTGWARMGANGFEPVRQIAIDEDWSALRFRRVQHIKTMTRSFAMTPEGQQKAQKNSL